MCFSVASSTLISDLLKQKVQKDQSFLTSSTEVGAHLKKDDPEDRTVRKKQKQTIELNERITRREKTKKR